MISSPHGARAALDTLELLGRTLCIFCWWAGHRAAQAAFKHTAVSMDMVGCLSHAAGSRSCRLCSAHTQVRRIPVIRWRAVSAFALFLPHLPPPPLRQPTHHHFVFNESICTYIVEL